jgi:hypothetical protein
MTSSNTSGKLSKLAACGVIDRACSPLLSTILSNQRSA